MQPDGRYTKLYPAPLGEATAGCLPGSLKPQFDPVKPSLGLLLGGLARFVGYDDPRAVRAKRELVAREGLAGLLAWELSQDDGRILDAMQPARRMNPVAEPRQPAAASGWRPSASVAAVLVRACLLRRLCLRAQPRPDGGSYRDTDADAQRQVAQRRTDPGTDGNARTEAQGETGLRLSWGLSAMSSLHVVNDCRQPNDLSRGIDSGYGLVRWREQAVQGPQYCRELPCGWVRGLGEMREDA